MSELKAKNISKEDLDELYKEYSKELTPDYSFNNIDFTKLSKDDTYLITIEVGEKESEEEVWNFCRVLKDALENKGFNNVMIIPLRNGLPLVKVYTKEKGE